MGGGFFGLIAGGFLGYYLAKDRGERGHGWGSGRGWGRSQWQQPTVPVESGTAEKPTQTINIAPDEFALFQQWRQQHSSALGGRPSFPSYAQAPAYNVDAVKASAVESADRALDVILSQVQGMKEKLAQHKGTVERTTPSSPQSEAGGFKLV